MGKGKPREKKVENPETSAAQAPRPRKLGYVFGWYYNSNGYRLYVRKRTPRTPREEIPSGYDASAWWPTEKPECATRFKSVEECLACFREIYWIKSDEERERFIRNALYILKETPSGLLEVRPVEQLSLLDLIPGHPTSTTRIDALLAKGFSLDEAKILSAGFSLARYVREEKRVDMALPGGPEPDAWLKGLAEKTFAAAERKLSAVLSDPLTVQVNPEGHVDNGKSIGKLTKVGFDFYRQEGVIKGHGKPRIKCYSRNWGTWQKYGSGAEVKAAWKELMKDEKALHG